jgi:hypothetical protein
MPPPLNRRRVTANLHGSRRGRHRIQKLCAGDEHDARAGDRQKHAAVARIEFEIMASPFNSTHSDCVGHQPGFGTGLDREQPTNFAEHHHH